LGWIAVIVDPFQGRVEECAPWQDHPTGRASHLE
jgi:hypothetical protein